MHYIIGVILLFLHIGCLIIFMESETEQSIIKALEAERKKSQDLQERIRQTEEETQKFVKIIIES